LAFAYLQRCGLATDHQPAEITLAYRQREILEIIVYINRAVRNKEHSF
jgi:hypothetical protein